MCTFPSWLHSKQIMHSGSGHLDENKDYDINKMKTQTKNPNKSIDLIWCEI